VCYDSVHAAAVACVPKTCVLVGGPANLAVELLGKRDGVEAVAAALAAGYVRGRATCCGGWRGAGVRESAEDAVWIGAWCMSQQRETSEGIGWLESVGADQDGEDVKAVEFMCRSIAMGLLRLQSRCARVGVLYRGNRS
jgi:hypothetical protein